MPRRVVAPRFGGPEVVELEDVAAREPTPGRVVIAVRSAGVNPSDLKSIAGTFGSDPARLPLRPGSEIAGTVTAVGPPEEGAETTELEVGDEVLASPVVGGFADEVLVPVRNVLRRPDTVPVDEAAGLLVAGTAAWHLVEATGVAAGDRVLVLGASGAVGSLAVQLARLRGARVIGASSSAGRESVEASGAEWIDRRALGAGLDRLLPDGADVALDAAGADEGLDAAVRVVADRARIATVAAIGRGIELGILALGAGGDPGTALRAAGRRSLVDLLAAGRIRVALGPAFALADARHALEAVAGGARGKVVLHAGDGLVRPDR